MGHSSGFRKTLEKDWKRLYRVAYAWCHDAPLAMDLVQDTIGKALKRQHQLRDDESINRWLFTILLNNWRDHCRKHREMIDIQESMTAHDMTPERYSDNRQTLENVRDAVARLNQDQREVLSLVVIEGMSYADTAGILGISRGTVMSRLSRARSQLRAYLEHGGQIQDSGPATVRRVK